MTTVTRLLLVDDHAVVREGYRRLLERRSDLRIVGGRRCRNYRLYKTGPDVAVLDLSLPDMGGIELIKRRCSATRMLASSPSACTATPFTPPKLCGPARSVT